MSPARRESSSSRFEITAAEAGEPDVAELVAAHLAFAAATTEPEDIHALDASGLAGSDVTLYALRRDGELLAMGALRDLGGAHGELKSMHTAERARGGGLGRMMLDHLLSIARGRTMDRVSLETGTMPAFAPAREMYRSAGFVECAPFAEYRTVATSVCMTLRLTPERARARV